jgi:hypothetical protein
MPQTRENSLPHFRKNKCHFFGKSTCRLQIYSIAAIMAYKSKKCQFLEQASQ